MTSFYFLAFIIYFALVADSIEGNISVNSDIIEASVIAVVQKSIMEVYNPANIQKGSNVASSAASFRGTSSVKMEATAPITYHTGPIMSSLTVYLIWYGSWVAVDQALIRQYLNDLSGSSYMNINAQYYQSSTSTDQYVSSMLTLSPKEYTNTATAALTDTSVFTQVIYAITANGQADPNGIYFVLSSANIGETSGFCSSYCGWHTYGTISSTNIKYSFVGNPTACLSGCAPKVGPNKNQAIDGMISVIAHELSETVSNPNLNAWYDSAGDENGDKCSWNYGTTSSVNGGFYNVVFNGRNYLTQQMWSLDTQACTLSAPGKTPVVTPTITPTRTPSTTTAKPTSATPVASPTITPTRTPSTPTAKPTSATPVASQTISPTRTPSTPTAKPTSATPVASQTISPTRATLTPTIKPISKSPVA